ncbi:MAG: NAD-dependent protein deacetylase [Gammaproteobacteria bacterium]|nr:NAD-dependent protein deacetylase [Gammaproteobacteria bacterium]
MFESTVSLDSFIKTLRDHQPWMVITGAGISLSSGIPTYRDDSGKWLRSDPIKHQEFIQYQDKRKRYWARSIVGWPPVARAQPNRIHRLLVKLEQLGLISGIVTQNVDRLHQKAGHQNVIDLHGRLDRARCLTCGEYEDRSMLQQRLIQENPFLDQQSAILAPDGDAYVEDELTERLTPVNCLKCNGTLMPDVVFFGGTVPKQTNIATANLYDKSNGLLVLGSSLMVYSGYRFCKLAHQNHKPLLIVNRGKTRADELATQKITAECGELLSSIVEHFDQ